jgi:hypothetical protein
VPRIRAWDEAEIADDENILLKDSRALPVPGGIER